MTLRRSGIRRSGGPRRHTRLNPRSRKQAKRDQRFRAVKLLVFTRDGYRCRMCGQGTALTPHHLLPRGQGGSDEPENIVTLDVACHSWVHENPAKSYEQGWLVRSGGGA